MSTTAEMVRVNGVMAWVDAPSSVLIKAVGKDGAPVQLDAADTRRLAERLLKLAATLESLQDEASEGA